MQKLSLELPKYRLAMHFRLIKRRKPLIEEPIIPSKKLINRRYRTGSLVGKLIRYFSEHKIARKVFTANFAAIVVISSFLPAGSTNVLAQSDTTVIEPETTLTTEKGIQLPVESLKVTQGFSFFHPGVDLDGITGDPIKPIKPGRVAVISYSKIAYGDSVLIDHGNQMSSLYAHLSKIEVTEGQEVFMNTEIGKMGATGHAFGDHLHLEIYDHGKAINPLTVLPR